MGICYMGMQQSMQISSKGSSLLSNGLQSKQAPTLLRLRWTWGSIRALQTMRQKGFW